MEGDMHTLDDRWYVVERKSDHKVVNIVRGYDSVKPFLMYPELFLVSKN